MKYKEKYFDELLELLDDTLKSGDRQALLDLSIKNLTFYMTML